MFAAPSGTFDAILLCDQPPEWILLKQALQGCDTNMVPQRFAYLRAMKLLQADVTSQKPIAQRCFPVPPFRWFHKIGGFFNGASSDQTLHHSAMQVLTLLRQCVGNEQDVAHFISLNPLPILEHLINRCVESLGIRSSKSHHLYIWLDMDHDSRRLGCIDVELMVLGTLCPTLRVSVTKTIDQLTTVLDPSRTLLLEAGLDYLCALPTKDPFVHLKDALDTLAKQVAGK